MTKQELLEDLEDYIRGLEGDLGTTYAEDAENLFSKVLDYLINDVVDPKASARGIIFALRQEAGLDA